MVVRTVLQRLYARRLRAQLVRGPVPRHVAIVMDGNRRWARQMGLDSPSDGHRHGCEHVDDVLRWCADLGIRRVTIFAASVDNLAKRSPSEVEAFLRLIEHVVAERLVSSSNRWRLHVAGRLDGLPDSTRDALKRAVDFTRDHDTDLELTVAVGYDGREEIVDAVRSLLDDASARGATLDEVARRIEPDDVAAHLYTAGHPDPDLVIRTSGEMRMSGFLLWQAAHAELYFCDVYWPGFRYIDFLRALRTYGRRRTVADSSSASYGGR